MDGKMEYEYGEDAMTGSIGILFLIVLLRICRRLVIG